MAVRAEAEKSERERPEGDGQATSKLKLGGSKMSRQEPWCRDVEMCEWVSGRAEWDRCLEKAGILIRETRAL